MKVSKLYFLGTSLVSGLLIDDYVDLQSLPSIVHESIIIRSCPQVIQLDSLTHLDGDLIIENCSQVVEISMQNLKYIQGDLKMSKLTSLVTLNIGKLDHVRSFQLKILPVLNFMNLNPKMMVDHDLIISDTSLTSIDSNDFDNIRQLDTLVINNNRFLESFLFNGLQKVSEQLAIHANAKEIEIELNSLVSTRNITIRDTSSISLQSLEYVHTSLELIENQFISANLPNLKFIGGTLGIINNVNLEHVNLNNLTDISGGLIVSNNDKLRRINFFSSLKQIGGAIHFEGRFDDISFEKLKLVKGSAFIKSTSTLLDCQKWISPMKGKSVVRGGKIECQNAKSMLGSLPINEVDYKTMFTPNKKETAATYDNHDKYGNNNNDVNNVNDDNSNMKIQFNSSSNTIYSSEGLMKWSTFLPIIFITSLFLISPILY
ncbi:Sporulation-specific protein 22 [Nakaseomyces bracarensis]|uniref:Sporulation-specific protein 22 n=1 Tax=Nakaseomyces bracarensis TaxID=273131 RepID=A0ABR4NYH6_9SACH